MKALLPALFITMAPVSSATEIITLGDSLTFAYEAEFGFQITIPFQGTVGDGFNPNEVKNWVEILDDERNSLFDLGERDTVSLDLFFFEVEFFFRQKNNWAVPGLKVDQLRRFITGESNFLALLAESPSFDQLVDILSLTDFNELNDFAIEDLEQQIMNSTGRLVFFIGGNDVDAVYGTVYNSEDPGTFLADYLEDSAVILDRVLELNPNLPVVLVNVPHVGITPNVQDSYPTDAVKTPLVTKFIRDLNLQLADLAASRNVAYADIFTATLPLLEDNPLSVYGVPFANSGSTTGDLDFVWLNGPLSQNFHPNTSGQALIANEIVCAFNSFYGTAIPPLTATEVLVDILGKTASEVDMDFQTWANSYSLPGLPTTDDRDGDSLPAALEFGLGLNPLYADSGKVLLSQVEMAGIPNLQLAYPLRLPTSSFVTVLPESTNDLTSPFVPFAIAPTVDSDGLARANLPIEGASGYLRLRANTN